MTFLLKCIHLVTFTTVLIRDKKFCVPLKWSFFLFFIYLFVFLIFTDVHGTKIVSKNYFISAEKRMTVSLGSIEGRITWKEIQFLKYSGKGNYIRHLFLLLSEIMCILELKWMKGLLLRYWSTWRIVVIMRLIWATNTMNISIEKKHWVHMLELQL